MKLIMFPLLFSIGFIAYENRDKIADQYNAAYPSDPPKAAALAECISRNRNFNRLDSDDRARCYERYLVAAGPRPLPPAAAPAYAFSPSHLAGNDVRRQEANASYHPGGGLISSAEAAPLVNPAAVPPRPALGVVRSTGALHSTAHPIHHAVPARHTTTSWQSR